MMPATLAQALARGATLFPQSINAPTRTRFAERWSLGSNDWLWYCRDCGALMSDYSAGCQTCGFGTESCHDHQ